MRIGFCGSHGVGKTTLANYIVEQIPVYTTVSSTSRQSLEAGYKINKDADELSQLIIMLSRMTKEDEIAQNNDLVVSDRTPIDSLAYALYQIDHLWGGLNKYYWDITVKLARSHLEKYDKIFYFPVFWMPEADGIRDTDLDYQKEIDRNILDLLDAFNLKYDVMINADVKERYEYFLNHGGLEF